MVSYIGFLKILKKHDKHSADPLRAKFLPLIQACTFYDSMLQANLLYNVDRLCLDHSDSEFDFGNFDGLEEEDEAGS